MDHQAAEIRKSVQEMIKKYVRKLSLFRRKNKTVLLYWDGEKLSGLEVKEGVIIKKCKVSLLQADPENIEEAADTLHEKGIDTRKSIFIIASPDLRYTVRRYPEMTRAELEETFYWDEDRAFAVKEPMQMAAYPIEHTPEGWTAVLTGIRKETFSLWKEALEKGGFSVEKMIPLMGLGKGPILLYGRRNTAFCLVKNGKERMWRVFHKETVKEKGLLFMERMEDVLGIREASISFIPMPACPREDWLFWEHLGDESGKNAKSVTNIFASKEDTEALMVEALASPLDFMASIRQKEKEKIRPLQRGRMIALAGLAALAIGAAQWGQAAWQLRKSQEKLSELQPVMVMKKKIEKGNKEAKETARKMNEEVPYSWLWAFSAISETIPETLRLDSIVSSGDAIFLQGTGQDRDSINAFAERLSSLGGPARIEKSAALQETGKVQYKIDWKIMEKAEK